MSRSSHRLRPFATLLLLLAGSAAFAQSPPPQEPPEPARQRGERGERGLPDSVRRVERETGGEVLRAEPMQRDGREVYRFKVLTSDGRVRVMQDDPNARRDEGGNRGKRNSKEKRPSRDSDGEPPQF